MNRYDLLRIGTALSLVLACACGDDDGTLDTGTVDTGTDGGGTDTGGMDTGGTDTGGTDTGGTDTGGTDTGADMTAPTVVSTSPVDGATLVPINRRVTVVFSEALSPDSVTAATFTLTGPGATSVEGTLTYSGRQATLSPLENLAIDTLYEGTITTGVTDVAGNPLAEDFLWSFTTGSTTASGPPPVLLGSAGNYAILAKSGITTVPNSVITGDIGVSPIDSTSLTGFSLAVHASGQYATSTQVSGQVHASDYATPTPANLTSAISAMETAHTDAAGRPTPDFTELGAGEIGGLTLVPGLYTWGTTVSISTNVTLDGGPDDVWIFQIAGDITQAAGTRVNLSGGALAKNIFWQSSGPVSLGTNSHMEGIVISQTAIILQTGASVNGRLLAQTAVTLDQSTVTQPAP